MPRALLPLLIPLGAILFTVVLILVIGNVLLAVSRTLAVPLALAIAMVVLAAAAFLSTRAGEPEQRP